MKKNSKTDLLEQKAPFPQLGETGLSLFGFTKSLLDSNV